MNLKNTLSGKSQTQKDKYSMIHLYKIPRIRKSIETKGRLEVVRGWAKREKSGMGFPFEVMKKFWS